MSESNQLSKNYTPSEFEGKIYQQWLQNRDFEPERVSPETGNTFTIALPPPNVTGVLHMGHGLNCVLQDILIRYEKMRGRPVLWIPGTDHAGIATQHVVEKKLLQQGKRREEIGRENFLKETWKIKEEHHTKIKEQLQKLGGAFDWSRERFTMDEGLSNAVLEVFVQLYREGLIYRGEYLINWCPRCGTALADEEVEHEEENGNLYELFYPLSDGDGGIAVATTRPETLFGDAAVAVHPDDERYRHLVGKTVQLPLTDRHIPVIADPFCDPAFGSGAVKITPAHDHNDWDVGQRHQLPIRNILLPDGTLNAEVPKAYQGLNCREARKLVVQDLKKQQFLRETVSHRHQVGHCYRCVNVIEPFLSKQWFVRMAPLAKEALTAFEKQQIRFYPERWGNTYRHWLENIRDWCISRQLWWGHRIPAWYCRNPGCGQTIVQKEPPTHCDACHGTELRQDEDVLDTWFSSWLWPFSTLGWPEKTPDFQRFYPTQSLVTAYDIIFFWVARMVMAGLKFTGQVPFSDIYITPLVRDKKGRKMSKSLGNGIDPLEVIDRYGADTLKFTISYLSTQGQDILLDLESFKLGARFCNKIWNAVRFLLLNLQNLIEEAGTLPKQAHPESDTAIDRWIWHRFGETVRAIARGREQYRFDEMSKACYHFFWNDFCDWYVEAAKVELRSEDQNRRLSAASKLITLLEASLRLLHPFVSFLSEELYSMLPADYRKAPSLSRAEYPEAPPAAPPAELRHIEQTQETVSAVRTMRSEFCIPPQQSFKIWIQNADPDFADFFHSQAPWLSALCQAEILSVPPTGTETREMIGLPLPHAEILLSIQHIIDLEKEQLRLQKQIAKEQKLLEALQRKLENPKFLDRAPSELVLEEREKQTKIQQTLRKNQRFLEQIQHYFDES